MEADTRVTRRMIVKKKYNVTFFDRQIVTRLQFQADDYTSKKFNATRERFFLNYLFVENLFCASFFMKYVQGI